MALTANRDLDHYIDQELRRAPVAAGKHIFKGGFVGRTSTGFVQPLTAGDPFAGIAYEEMDNTTGANGDKTVRLFTLGDFAHDLSGIATDRIGAPVFASADDTLTLDGGTNSYVGRVRDVPSAGQIILRIDTNRAAIKSLGYEVENLGAGQNITARAIHGFDQETWLVSARVVNQTSAAVGIDDSNTFVVTLATDAGTVVAETFDSTTVFPDPNESADIGVLSNTRVTPGDVLTLAVTSGASANPGSFLIQVDYV